MMPLIEVTAPAVAALQAVCAGGSQGLRVTATREGCSGVRYGLARDDVVHDGDVIQDVGELRFILDGGCLRFLEGARIDFVGEGDVPGFAIDNPRLAASCSLPKAFRRGCQGCGS